jgi:hypothetical protein
VDRDWGGLLEGDAVLGDGVVAGLPDEGEVAGVGGLEPPGEEAGDGIAADYTDAVGQRRLHDGTMSGGEGGMGGSMGGSMGCSMGWSMWKHRDKS